MRNRRFAAGLFVALLVTVILCGCTKGRSIVMFTGQTMPADQVAVLRGEGPAWVVSIDGKVKEGFYKDCGPFAVTECNAWRYQIHLPPGKHQVVLKYDMTSDTSSATAVERRWVSDPQTVEFTAVAGRTYEIKVPDEYKLKKDVRFRPYIEDVTKTK